MRMLRLARTAVLAAAFLAVGLFVQTSPAASPARTLKGTVTSVIDGDTVRVKLSVGGTETVRLIGVNSQELDDARENVRLMAFLAKRYATSRLYQKAVELLPGPEARDGYGRVLAFVRLADGELFNVTLVREGYAFAFLKFPFDDALQKELKAAEAEARRAGRGLWGREPRPLISASEAGGAVGGLFTVRFRCLRSYRRGGFRLLEAEGAAFDAAVPLDVFRALPGSLDFEGRMLEATGLIELYKGRPQIVVGLPAQLKSIDR